MSRSAAEAVRRRYSSRSAIGSNRAHDSELLVCTMQEGRRTQSYGCLAALAAGQSRRCPVGLAALRFGKHPLADLQRFQSPLATEGHAGRFDWHMASTARGTFSVV